MDMEQTFFLSKRDMEQTSYLGDHSEVVLDVVHVKESHMARANRDSWLIDKGGDQTQLVMPQTQLPITSASSW